MITRFSGEKYKAFDSFDLTIKPLTILLGANSCGKSAIINSLLMLSQTAETNFMSESALRLNGNKVGMGEILNIIKDKKAENILSFSFEIDESKIIKENIERIKRECIESYIMPIRYVGYLFRRDNTTNASDEYLDSILYDLDVAYVGSDGMKKRLKNISSKIIAGIKYYRAQKDSIKKVKMPKALSDFLDNVSFKKIDDCFNKLLSIQSTRLSADKISYSFKYHKKEDAMIVSRLFLYNKNNELIISVTNEKSKVVNFESDIIDVSVLKNSKSDIQKLLNLSSLSIVKNSSIRTTSIDILRDSNNPFAFFLSRVLQASISQLMNELSDTNINHVSPLRAFPQRYYLLDKSVYHNQLNALDGTELAEVLKKNPKIKDEINNLFAEFNIAIDVEKVNDIIHKITVNQESVNLELTDVGFGISQVLPILVQAYLSPQYSITIIEQPEIHLHPKMQAWLADALIEIALNGKKRFLIETHSDALVRRIRLRIVDSDNKLSEDDVRIYHLERNNLNNCTHLNKIPINSDGDIKWPSEFMDVEINDTLMIQQFKFNRISRNSQGK
ncbi:AAA family ATPase [Budviciaceae bacterium CWB-B4]|uniref:AAA family ATPase n=1 Tax=Limnobaculum xujianqingii TaxID=2738837 RepID=A0A9D7AIW0_9GAMM|nr:AAA family ATPase [Limnobaculum xujianqingii]MBK5073381.1 AAA family ATPase [Limnobaculum xujianqingii]MBK5176888.1 AAA family ATPase [Limnobaculum xujianqingii]